MICTRCVLRASRSQTRPSLFLRSHFNTTSLSSATSSLDAAPQAKPRNDASDSNSSPASTSTSASKPFSTSLSPSPTTLGVSGKKAAGSVVVQSCVPAGTTLKGLNYHKNKADPVAMEDWEYPDWLWDILKVKKKELLDDADDHLFSKSKKQRRIAAKKAKKRAEMDPESLIPKVPLYEQSIDLPAGDGTVKGALEAETAREELTKAMRGKRRSAIKEDNFLKTMR